MGQNLVYENCHLKVCQKFISRQIISYILQMPYDFMMISSGQELSFSPQFPNLQVEDLNKMYSYCLWWNSIASWRVNCNWYSLNFLITHADSSVSDAVKSKLSKTVLKNQPSLRFICYCASDTFKVCASSLPKWLKKKKKINHVFSSSSKIPNFSQQ